MSTVKPSAMEEKRCLACDNPLSVGDRWDRRTYRRTCCSASMHHQCIRNTDLATCSRCGTSPGGLIFVPLEIPDESPDVVIIDSSDDEGDAYQPLKKRGRTEGTCVICMEGDENVQDPLLEASCCRQKGHVSCLRQYYEIPPECKSVTERREIAANVGIPKCFVCRVQRSNGKTGLEEVVTALLPKVTKNRERISVEEANRTLDSWFTMFANHIDTQTKHCHFYMTINSMNGWATRRDGRTEIFQIGRKEERLRVGAFREELKEFTKRMIRLWSGLPLLAKKFTKRSVSRFSLDDIVEVALQFSITNSYYSVRTPDDDPCAVPFATTTELKVISTWELNGHFFDFEDVTETKNSKLARWNNNRIERTDF